MSRPTALRRCGICGRRHIPPMPAELRPVVPLSAALPPEALALLARVAVLGEAATLGGVLHGLGPGLEALRRASLVRVERGDTGWGRYALTPRGRVVLATEAARLAGRTLPASRRQLELDL